MHFVQLECLTPQMEYIYIVQLQVYCLATCVEYIWINPLILLVDNGNVDMTYMHPMHACVHYDHMASFN